MLYSDVYELAQQLEALHGQGDRTAGAHALRIWKARRTWGGLPTPEHWEAIFAAGKNAAEWIQERQVEAPAPITRLC